MNTYQQRLQELLILAEIEVNGNGPWDPQILDDRFYKRVITEGSIGLGESYMDQWWEVEALDQLFCKFLSTDIERRVKNKRFYLHYIYSRLFNLQNIRRAFRVGEQHYDIGNDLFSKMLDERLTYTCAYWKTAQTLDQAQEDKLDLVCRKIGLQKNQRVLDIGCGWGSFAKFAAEKYAANIVGVTVSKEQAEYAKTICKGLPVDIRLQDYRKLNENFDHIVSLGMFEHVGHKNFRTYMQVADRCLNAEGIFLLHTIGSNYTRRSPDPWVNKYIFPNGVLPSLKDISTAIEHLFVVEDFHSFGPDYDKTLMAWFENFDNHWPTLSTKYDERFYRMWKYYLLGCAGAFRSRNIQLWQFVLTKHGIKSGYDIVR